nr:RNA-directed DNA polymerase, eukaryota [Tanacetum cinerariifolium]
MFFKVDFAKAYDSVRWDYLLDVLEAFGFSNIWCKWIRGTFSSAKASVLVNGSPTIEFSFIVGSNKAILCVFKGVHLHGSTFISHLFYADDVMFVEEWSDDNLKGIINILQCFFLVSGLKINIQNSQVLGVGVPSSIVRQVASSISCGVLHKQFRYLGVMVGECMSCHNAWASTVDKLRSPLSKWKVKTLSIGGRLTLLKAVLGASPLSNMSIFKVPKAILNSMEAIRGKFFNGMEPSTNKITWAAWNKVLALKENGGLGVSSYHTFNRALLLKWVWRFISQDGSLWFRVIKALDTCFWYDKWLGDKPLKDLFPRLFALELNKEVTVADKVQGVVSSSFRHPVRVGSEYQHLTDLNSLMESVTFGASGFGELSALLRPRFWLKINIQKSQVLGVGVPSSIVMQAASSIGCGVLHKQFRYLGVMVRECTSRHNAWASTVDKLRSRLFKWKVKSNMSIFKVPKGILNSVEAIR